MSRVRLIERLNRHPDERSRRRMRDEKRVQESVTFHIRQLLNTRRGNVPIDPDFGMPAMPRGGSGDAADQVNEAVRELLERYEPRISNITVDSQGFSGRQLGLDIEIKASVAYPNRPLPLHIRGTMLADGRFVF